MIWCNEREAPPVPCKRGDLSNRIGGGAAAETPRPLLPVTEAAGRAKVDDVLGATTQHKYTQSCERLGSQRTVTLCFRHDSTGLKLRSVQRIASFNASCRRPRSAGWNPARRHPLILR